MAEQVTLRRSLRIEWKVENLFSVNGLPIQVIRFGDSRCNLRLNRFQRGKKEYFKIHISRVKLYKPPLNGMRAEIFIEDRNQRPQFTMDNRNINRECVVWWQYISDLRKEEENILTDGVVTFVCVITEEATHEGKMETEVATQTDMNFYTKGCLENLSLDLHNFMDVSLLSDVTLQCGDRSIPVHKSILCARSEVFLAMLRSDMAESRRGVIEISDMEPSTLGQLVQYIYSGRVSDMSLDSAQQLYAAADKYAIGSLKKLSGNFMKENLTGENAFNFLALADLHSDKDLKDYALSFVVKADLLRDEENWLGFHEKCPKLAAEVLYHAYKAKSFPK